MVLLKGLDVDFSGGQVPLGAFRWFLGFSPSRIPFQELFQVELFEGFASKGWKHAIGIAPWISVSCLAQVNGIQTPNRCRRTWLVGMMLFVSSP